MKLKKSMNVELENRHKIFYDQGISWKDGGLDRKKLVLHLEGTKKYFVYFLILNLIINALT